MINLSFMNLVSVNSKLLHSTISIKDEERENKHSNQHFQCDLNMFFCLLLWKVKRKAISMTRLIG